MATIESLVPLLLGIMLTSGVVFVLALLSVRLWLPDTPPLLVDILPIVTVIVGSLTAIPLALVVLRWFIKWLIA